MSGPIQQLTAAHLGSTIVGLDELVYHRGLVDGEESLSHSGMKTLLSRTPAHFRHEVDHPEDRDAKPEFDLGSAFHAKVLGVGKVVVIRKSAGKYDRSDYGQGDPVKIWAAGDIAAKRALAYSRGDVPLKSSQAELVEAMAAELRRNKMAAELLEQGSGRPELSAFVRDPETGVILRGRVDWWRHDGQLVDVKTAGRVGGAAPSGFGRHGLEYGYHLQAAVYEHIAQLCGFEFRGFHFIVQETTAPFAVSVVHFGPESIELGRLHMRRAIALFAECQTAGVWPGYPAESIEVDVPRWALTQAGIQTSTSSELSGDSNTDVSGLLDDLERILAE